MTFTFFKHPVHIGLNRGLFDTFRIASSECFPVLEVGVIVDMVDDGGGDTLYARHIISENYIV